MDSRPGDDLPHPTTDRGELALVMSGGGARGAYQAGVLKGIARHFPQVSFPILTGVSAGAINQAYLASQPGGLQQRAAGLEQMWSELSTEQVFEVGSLDLVRRVFGWGMRLFSGGHLGSGMRSMVDMSPLQRSLSWLMRAENGVLTGIDENLESGALSAIAVTTASYTTGQSITWVQGREIEHWERADRKSVACDLTIKHILASAALPVFFPAVRIGGDYYGDGGMRLTAPLSPAIHLGANRILAISTRYIPDYPEYPRLREDGSVPYPPPAQIAGVLLGTIFLDQFDGDALRLQRINDLIRARPEEERGLLRPVELLLIRPSEDLGRLARDYEAKLPGAFRWLERGLGTKTNGNVLLSMVMFQRDYARRLIEVGEKDAERNLEAFARFVDG